MDSALDIVTQYKKSGARVLVITGPTASGKSSLAVQCALLLHGEVISADSRQVYIGMDVGTGKITPKEMQGVPHHGLDIAGPEMTFTVADFVSYAEEKIEEVIARGHVPIIAGGTGLYINGLVLGLSLGSTSDPKVRAELELELETKGREYMYKKLLETDPMEAARIDKNNARYILRALEIHTVTGKLKSEQVTYDPEKVKQYMVVVLAPERTALYKKINQRHEDMFTTGKLMQETKRLLELGYTRTHEAMTSIGYRECLGVLDGNLSDAEALDSIQKAARHYAKRQETWFRRLGRTITIYWMTS